MSEPVLLDAKGLKCPLPVLKARKALQALPAGGTLRILATDPGAAKDFAHFCETTGARLIASREADGVLDITLEKPPA